MEFVTHPITRPLRIEGFNSIYYFEFGKDFSHPPEKHDFWELVYVDSGEIIAVTDGLGRPLRQGQVIFHKPGEVHAHVSNRVVPNNMLVVSFTARGKGMRFFDDQIFDLDKTAKTLLTLFINEAKTALGALPGEYGNKNPLDFSSAPAGSMQLMECYLTELLLVLQRSGQGAGRIIRREDSLELAQSSMMELILHYLKENLHQDLTYHDICREFLMGKSRLYQLFEEQVGQSPMDYFAALKMSEAKRLLREGELTVSQISDCLAFSSIHNFSRAFKKRVGMSPTAYRKKIN